MPSDPPTSMPNAIAAKPTVSEMRAPQIVRLNMSRDSWSVPNQNSHDGRVRRTLTGDDVGLLGILERQPRREDRGQDDERR